LKSTASGNLANVIQAIYALPTAAQAQGAYNQISGDSLASFQASGLRSAEVFSNQMNARVTPAGFSDSAQIMATPQVVYAGDLLGSALGFDTAPIPSTHTVTTTPSSMYGLWTRGLGFLDTVKGNSATGSPESHDTTGGFQAGYDLMLTDEVLFGLSGGCAQ